MKLSKILMQTDNHHVTIIGEIKWINYAIENLLKMEQNEKNRPAHHVGDPRRNYHQYISMLYEKLEHHVGDWGWEMLPFAWDTHTELSKIYNTFKPEFLKWMGLTHDRGKREYYFQIADLNKFLETFKQHWTIYVQMILNDIDDFASKNNQ